MNMQLFDTIIAPATPPGKGALAVIRLSGPDTFSSARQCITPQTSWNNLKANSQVLADFYGPDQKLVDRVMVVKFIQPHSFTGEDSLEIYCHGGPFLVQTILERFLDLGVRLAMPGEFTRRAFMNGKIDLLQAEAIHDLIEAKTKNSLQLSLDQYQGRLSHSLSELTAELREYAALLELELDFSEEDLEFVNREQLLQKMDKIIAPVSSLLDSFEHGKLVNTGINVAIIGKPNVGKSSLLNALLNEDRALVTDLAGTTRDSIRESLDIEGQLYNLIDTAGIRRTKDRLELLGLQKTDQAIDKADLILAVFDQSQPLDTDDRLNLEKISGLTKRVLVVLNKSDQPAQLSADDFDFQSVSVSATQLDGLEDLKKSMITAFQMDYDQSYMILINKPRHRDSLKRTMNHLNHARESLVNQLSAEFIAIDIRAALDAIGELTGHISRDDILNDIFSHYCIGK
jgi:tRNA modification GTPase